ncbi:MAG: hypothetical protein LBP28_03515, partial [Coriobacteriales bacterium]|nr:hypothetical protein [Coriobacteriales bacterium]
MNALEKDCKGTTGVERGVSGDKSGHRDGSSVLGGHDTEGRFFCVPGKTIACDETLFPGIQKNRPSVSCPPRTDEPSLCPLMSPETTRSTPVVP